MSAPPRPSGITNTTAHSDRIGTIRRFNYSIAINLVHESDDGRIFRLATLPGSGGAVLGEVVCRVGQASPLWERTAAEMGVVEGSMFASGLIRTVLAVDAAREGTPVNLDEHGLRLDARSRFSLPTVQEAAS
jgi:hypothetical protein